MKSSAEYKEWLHTLKGKSEYRENLKDVNLNFKEMPIFVCRNEDILFYSIGKLKTTGASVGNATKVNRNDYEVKHSLNWNAVCCDCSCWKRSAVKGKCEEHGERSQELFLVSDKHNKDVVVIMMFNARPRSSDFNQQHMNEIIHSTEGQQNQSLWEYMKERGVPEAIPNNVRKTQYEAMKYSDKNIQQLEKNYWKQRFSKVEFEVLAKWKLPYSKKDVYNKIYDTVQVFILDLAFEIFIG